MKSPSEIIRAYFACYETKNREALEALVARDFTFTSPLDNAISRERYFERCWPNSAHIDAIQIEKLFVQGDEAFVQYQLQASGKPPFRNTEFFTVRDGLVTQVVVYFGAETGAGAEAEEEIRAVIEAWADAIRRKDVEGVAAQVAPDMVEFALAPPLQSTGSLKEELKGWFATFRGDIGYEIRDLAITTSADLAYGHSFHRLTGTKTDGERPDVWFRVTLCLRRTDGRWLISHVHESVPFYMDGSFKAAVDLKPA